MFFRSGIARRIMGCLLAAALLPLAGSAFLSLDLVTNLLLEQGHARLARFGEDYASALRDRLLTVESRLHELSTRSDLGATPRGDDRTRRQREFKAIGIFDDAGRVVPLFGDIEGAPLPDAAQAERLGRGGTILATTVGAGGTTRLWASTGYELASGRSQRIVAEIDSSYLWRRLADPATRTGICVGDAKGKPLACTQEAAPTVLQAFALPLREGAAKRESFADGGVAYLASHHLLALEPTIAGRGWSVIATRPVSDVLAPIEELQSMLLAMAAIAAVFVAVLGVTRGPPHGTRCRRPAGRPAQGGREGFHRARRRQGQ